MKKWANAKENKVEKDVIQWLVDAEKNVQCPYHPESGWIKIGFIAAFRHLVLGSSYSDAIRETLIGGGDTDTNAAIVGKNFTGFYFVVAHSGKAV